MSWIAEDAVVRDRAEALAERPGRGHRALPAGFELVGSDEALGDGEDDRGLGRAGVDHGFVGVDAGRRQSLVHQLHERRAVGERVDRGVDLAGDVGGESVHEKREVRAVPFDRADRAHDGVGALVECGLHLRPGEPIEDDRVGQWRSSR